MRLLRNYLIASGLVASLLLALTPLFVLRNYDLTPREAIERGIDRLGVGDTWVESFVQPDARYGNQPLDGSLRTGRPRILPPKVDGAGAPGGPALPENRLAAYHPDDRANVSGTCGRSLLASATCWFLRGQVETGRRALDQLEHFETQRPSATTRYGNGWQLALAYDLLAAHPELADGLRTRTNLKLQRALGQYLAVLDGSSASLWHGRSTLAAQAWLIAVAMDESGIPERRELRRRAQGHFLDTMEALDLTQAWPEGYNYWINSRAFLLTLAASAYVNGLEDSHHASSIRETMRRVGLWHVHATRPDHRVEGLADEGSRVDLREETRRPIDIMATLTRDPALAGYSRFLGQIHGPRSYYRGYRWGFGLFNDPTLTGPRAQAVGSLGFLQNLLPSAELFGPGAMNLAYLRSHWGEDATFISFRAGHTFTHHGHYDAGHFSLFKGAPLAVNSSTYAGIRKPHRLNYAIRTVAKNSLLILRPGEQVRPNRFFEPNVAAGGQRITLPTGSAITSVPDWRANLNAGLHLEGGELLHFEHDAQRYTYLQADLTRAYNNPEHDSGGRGGKAKRVVRSLLYLRPDDRLLVFDEVTVTEPEYTARWLLHSVNRPDAEETGRNLTGTPDNGIIRYPATRMRISNGRGRLLVDPVEPGKGHWQLIGGPDYQYYVDVDGDAATLDGINFQEGASLKPWFDVALWRLELQAEQSRRDGRFMVLLSPSLDAFREEPVLPIEAAGAFTNALQAGSQGVAFAAADGQGGELRLEAPLSRLYLTGLPGQTQVGTDGDGPSTITSAAGIAVLDWPEGRPPGVLRLDWQESGVGQALRYRPPPAGAGTALR